MRRLSLEIAGVVLAFTLAGCGESQPESGPVQYKAPNPAGIDKQLDIMSQNAKNKVTTTKPKETKAGEKKPADTPPAETAPAEKKK
ncbi:MAG: hypothetical protein ACHRXM_01640 [Isosphaerales bacterium]